MKSQKPPKFRTIATRKGATTIIITMIIAIESAFAGFESFPVRVTKPNEVKAVDFIAVLAGRGSLVLLSLSGDTSAPTCRPTSSSFFSAPSSTYFAAAIYSATLTAFYTLPEPAILEPELLRLDTNVLHNYYGAITTPSEDKFNVAAPISVKFLHSSSA